MTTLALQATAARIDEIPEFKPRAQYCTRIEAPIITCNATAPPQRETQGQSS
jgi:hypothetical protein